ncbi:hypothetical protein SAMN05878503_10551 [Cereibacter ovatus]|uniref:Uncharacterized protein n=1 Tax=Cereibacter ovatus TaxID=439529 RepID=A0A285CRH7_9RHOB|nr:hypothetical protein [Cereibacter ovatus]SNX70142.1 hypothetical protein SAMN05878503_10551 [Cereibacter ovatus]
MPNVLTEAAHLSCAHGGRVGLAASQDLVRIGRVPVLVRPDLLGRPIAACPHATPSTPPCLQTVVVDDAASYSGFVTIDGRPVAKATAQGRTDWSKLGVVPFGVDAAGQDFVSVSE